MEVEYYHPQHTIYSKMFTSSTESIALQFIAAFELYNEHDELFFDGDNGFNKCNRGQGLFQVMQHFPILYPLVDMLYGKNGDAKGHWGINYFLDFI